MELQYVYLIQEREFVQSGKPIFKIGKTKQPNFARLNQYPKGSVVIHHSACFNCDECEKEIITFFKLKYHQRSDIGSEYFEGNYKVMICDILLISLRLWNEGHNDKTLSDLKIYSCLNCNYSTKSNSNFHKHFKSSKHINNVQFPDSNITTFHCIQCNKYYKAQSGLWSHKKVCKNITQTDVP
jgi:hypothetical protein